MKNFYSKKFFLFSGYLVSIILLSSCFIFSQEKIDSVQKENFYTKSLHYTNNGIKYWYSKEQGGVERIAGKTADELNCTSAKCHAYTCDACHLDVSNGVSFYSLKPLKNNDICKKCHNSDEEGPDVHFQKEMKCMDCHTAKEIHGDGIAHNTYYEPGIFDVHCENCHSKISGSLSHTVHNGKLDCGTCHITETSICINCHFDIKKRIPAIKNMLFLVNKDDKVILGNILTFISKNKTMVTVAPGFSHSIRKDGRKCGECHNTVNLKNISKNKFSFKIHNY